MLRFNLVNGKIKFVAYGVDDGKRVHRFYDESTKDAFCQKLDEQAIQYNVETYDTPDKELLAKVENVKFNTPQEAKDFLGGKLDEITEIQLALVELYEMILGGAE